MQLFALLALNDVLLSIVLIISMATSYFVFQILKKIKLPPLLPSPNDCEGPFEVYIDRNSINTYGEANNDFYNVTFNLLPCGDGVNISDYSVKYVSPAVEDEEAIGSFFIEKNKQGNENGQYDLQVHIEYDESQSYYLIQEYHNYISGPKPPPINTDDPR